MVPAAGTSYPDAGGLIGLSLPRGKRSAEGYGSRDRFIV